MQGLSLGQPGLRQQRRGKPPSQYKPPEPAAEAGQQHWEYAHGQFRHCPRLNETSRDVAAPARTETPRVVAASAYVHGRRVADVAIDEAGAWAKRPDHVVWIGLLEPTLDMLRQVQVQFDLHPLAIEDAGKAHQRPKLDQYGTGVFIVARTAQLVNGASRSGRPTCLRARAMSCRSATAPRCPTRRCASAARPAPTLSHGEDYFLGLHHRQLHAVLETIQAEAETIEDQVLKRELMPAEIERLYLLRRDLLRLRNAVVLRVGGHPGGPDGGGRNLRHELQEHART